MKTIFTLFLVLSVLSLSAQSKIYDTNIDIKKIKAKCDKIITKPGELGDEYSVVKKDGNLAVYSYKLDSLVETKIDSFMATGCFNDLLVFKGDSLGMTDVNNQWVTLYLPDIVKIEEAECEFTEMQLETKNGDKYELWPFSATLIKLGKENQKECLDLIENIPPKLDENDYDWHGDIKYRLKSYYSLCDCDSTNKAKLEKTIRQLDYYPRFFELKLSTMTMGYKDGQLQKRHLKSVEGADAEECSKRLHELHQKSGKETVTLKTLLQLEKEGCIRLEYP